MPPASKVSSCLDPVVMEISSERRWCISVAVVKPMGTSLEAVGGSRISEVVDMVGEGEGGRSIDLLRGSWWLFALRCL